MELHAPLQQLSFLINVQALSRWPPSFEWHFRVQAEITSTLTKLTWTSFPYQRCSPAVKYIVCLCVCVCVYLFIYVCVCVCARSHFCIVSVVWCVRGTQAHSGESIWDIYYALHQSFWTLDISLAEQIVSYQNSISEMTCRNSPPPSTEPNPTPSPLLLTLLLPFSLSIYLFAFTYMPTRRIFPNNCTHTRTKTPCTCTHTLRRTNEVQFPPPPLHSPLSHLSLSLKQLSDG